MRNILTNNRRIWMYLVEVPAEMQTQRIMRQLTTQTGFEESIYPFLSTNWKHSWYKPTKWTHLPTTWTRHVHLPVPTCAFPSVFKEGSISSLAQTVVKVSLTWASSMVDDNLWYCLNSTNNNTSWKYLETWLKPLDALKKGVNTAYSKCTCLFTKFISRFLMLCFFLHLHVLRYCCCEPKATNQRNVFWVRCRCHIWMGIIPARKWLTTMDYGILWLVSPLTGIVPLPNWFFGPHYTDVATKSNCRKSSKNGASQKLLIFWALRQLDVGCLLVVGWFISTFGKKRKPEETMMILLPADIQGGQFHDCPVGNDSTA